MEFSCTGACFYIKNPRKLQIEKVEVYDVLGKRVKFFKSNAGVYDVTDLKNGHYFLNLFSEKGQSVQRIIKR